MLVDEKGAIVDVNAAFEKLFGWARDEILGRPLVTIIPPSLHEAHQRGFSRFLSTGVATLLGRPIALKALTKDGVVFDAEHVIVSERRANGERCFAATIRKL